MHSLTKYPLSRETSIQQTQMLNKSIGLFNLFDKFQAFPIFKVPENSVVVDLENITFGPGRYSVRLEEDNHLFFKIVYYCILHFIFEKAYDARNLQAYQQLLNFIFTQEIHLQQPLVGLTQEEVKVYLVKFLHLLERAKSKRKVVVEELNNLPQIDALLVALVRQAAKHSQLLFQQNAREVEKNIAAAFGIEFDLLSCELFLFAGEFHVQIRHFDSICEFAVTREKPQIIQKIKDDFYLGQSAYFMAEQPLLNGFEASFRKPTPKTANKVTKKDTIRSIEWAQSEDDNETEVDRSWQVADPEKMDNSSISQRKEDGLEKGNGASVLFGTQDRTIADTSERPSLLPKPRLLNFQEIIKQSSKPVLFEPSKTFHSKTIQRWHQTSTVSSSLRQIGKFHKPSFYQSDFSWAARPKLKYMPFSKSVQDIGLPRQQRQYSKVGRDSRKEKRVPAFILNRAKQQTHKPKINLEQLSPIAPSIRSVTPKITFTYTKK